MLALKCIFFSKILFIYFKERESEHEQGWREGERQMKRERKNYK